MTYAGDPSANNRDRIRFLLQDTSNDSTKELLTDTEITGMLSLQSNVRLAAAELAEVIAAKFGQLLDHSVLSTSVTASTRAQFYLDLARRLRESANILCTIAVGGRTLSNKEALDSDSTLVQPVFRRGMDDNGSSNGDYQSEGES